jgi:eukaryotic-like serine/threonine-protein kinase
MMLGRIGDVIVGRYRLDRPVGGAVGGEAWQAFDQRLARPVVVRITPAGPLAGADADRLVAAMAQLNHPGIAAIYDVGVTDDFGYTVSEWTEGRTLAQIMATGPQNWHRVSDWGQQTGAALAALHAAGLTHGALGPETIVIHDDRQVKVLDAGIATLGQQIPPGPGGTGPGTDETQLIPPRPDGSRPGAAGHGDDETQLIGSGPGDRGDDATQLLGSPGADDPTRVLRRDALSGPAEDVWALGALSWQAVVGPGQPAVPRGSAPDPLRLRATTASTGFSDLVLRMLAVDPAARPTAMQSSDGFAALLAEKRQSGPVPVPAVLPIAPTQVVRPPTAPIAPVAPAGAAAAASGSRRGLAIGLVLLIAAVGVGVGLYVANAGGNAGTAVPVSSTSTTGGVPVTTGSVVLPSASLTSASPSASPSSTPSTTPPTTPSTSPPAPPSPSSSPSAAASDSPSASASPTPPAVSPGDTGAAASSSPTSTPTS